MGLGLNTQTSSGDILPRVQFDAKAGRLFKVDRIQGSDGGWVSDKIDLTFEKPTFIFDMGSIEVGYSAFLPTGPDFHMVPLGSALPAKPSADHKQGFRARLYGQKYLDGIREFSSSSKAVLNAIDALHSAFEAAPEAQEGKVPVVRMSGATPITTKGKAGTTTNYSPVFEIIQWADRPDDLGERTVAVPGTAKAAAAPAQAQASAATRHVPAPAVKQPEAESVEASDLPF